MRRLVLLLALLVPVGAAAQPATDALTPAQQEILSAGIRDFDAGRFEEARVRYATVVADNPTNPVARYELAQALIRLDRLDDALAELKEGVRRVKSAPMRGQFWHLRGVVLDGRGRSEEAEAAFRAGLKDHPAYAPLHQSLGIVLLRQRRLAEAEEAFTQTLRLNPFQKQSHLILAGLAQDDGRRGAAALGYALFATLATDDPRLPAVQQRVGELLTPERRGDELVISLPSGSGTFEAMFGLRVAAAAVVQDTLGALTGDTTRVGRYVRTMGMIVQALGADAGHEGSVLRDVYAPFYRQLAKDGLAEPFFYWVFRNDADGSADAWLRAHPDDLARLRTWINAYGG